MSTFSWMILYFLQLYVLHVRSDRNDSFLSLFQLQINHCGAVSTCGMDYHSQKALDKNETCCTSCSCVDNCTRQGTCCPDFELKDVLSVNKSTSIDNYQERLLQLGVDIAQVGTSPRNINDDVTTCVVAAAAATSNYLPGQSRMRGNYYQMIATCPSNTPYTDIYLEQKCTWTNSGTLERGEVLKSLTPVTSLVTKRTYKNVYCLKCNEMGTDEEFIVNWRIVYTCTNTSEDTIPELNLFNMGSVFKQIDSETRCSITFKPKELAAPLVTECIPVDVDECPPDSTWQLKNICRKYHYPVNVPQEGQAVTYKNLACYLCHNEEYSDPVCTMKTSSSDYSLELNMPDERATALSQGENNLQVSFVFGRLKRCFMGYMFDPILQACTRVICPRLFYNLKGSCVPTFTQLENIYFTIIFHIQFRNDKTQNNPNSYFDVIRKNVRKLAYGLFGQSTFGLWENNGKGIMVFSFVPAAKDRTYVKLLESLSTFLEQISFAKLVPDVDTITYIAKDSSHVFVNGHLREHGRKQFLFPFWPYKAMGNTKREIRIKTSHLCYRMNLKNVNTFLGKRGYTFIKKTKVMLSPDEVTELQNGNLAVCFDDLYEKYRNISFTYMYGGISARARATVQPSERKDKAGRQKGSKSVKGGKIPAFEFKRGKPVGVSDDVSEGLLIIAAFALAGVVLFAIRKLSQSTQREPYSVGFDSRSDDGVIKSIGHVDIDKTTQRF